MTCWYHTTPSKLCDKCMDDERRKAAAHAVDAGQAVEALCGFAARLAEDWTPFPNGMEVDRALAGMVGPPRNYGEASFKREYPDGLDYVMPYATTPAGKWATIECMWQAGLLPGSPQPADGDDDEDGCDDPECDCGGGS